MTVEVTTTFDEPFFTGDGSEVDDWSMPVSVNGRSFLIDTDPTADFQRKSIKLLNTQVAQTGQDYAMDPPTVWRRSTESWHSGADQSRFDRPDSLETRFHRSVGVDPWKRYGIELLNDVIPLKGIGLTEKAMLVSRGDILYIAVGNQVWDYASVLDPTPTVHALPSPVVSMCSDGENVYILCDNGVVQMHNSSEVWSTFYTEPGLNPAKAMLAYVKGFIVLGNGPALKNITSGAAVLIYLHPLTSWWWREAAEGLSVIYILGGMGDRWHVHSVTIAKTGATLDPPIVAATMPDGEIAYAIQTYMGYVLIGVNSGWRFAMPDSSGALTYGQLIETSGPVRCFEGQGRFVWFGLSILSGAPPNPSSIYAVNAGLGRADLSQFVAPMTPASASDLLSPGFGVTRSVVSVGGEWSGIGLRVFSVDGLGVYYQAESLVAQGWLEQGVFTFNSTDKKMGLYGQVFTEPLQGTVEVKVGIDSDQGFWTSIGKNDNQGSVTLGNMPFPFEFNNLELRYYLNRDPARPESGPRVVRSEFRAINIPGRATEWHIPLLLYQDTNYNDAERTRSVADDYDFLMSLVRSRHLFTYREGDRIWNLHATDFMWKPNTLTSDRKTYNGTYTLIAREIT